MGLAGWPYTALHTTFVAIRQVPSAFLNELQERVKDLFEAHLRTEPWFTAEDDAGQISWEIDPGDPQHGAACLSAGKILRCAIRSRRRFYCTSVRVKVFNAGAASLTAELFVVDAKITNTPAVAPSKTSKASANAVSAGAWEVLLLTPAADIELADDEYLIVLITGASVGDKIAAVQPTCHTVKAA